VARLRSLWAALDVAESSRLGVPRTTTWRKWC